MTKSRLSDALRRSVPILLVATAVATGVGMRVRFLHHEMLTRWHGALDGGALTTQATVDEWFLDRRADAEALATSIAVHAAFPYEGDAAPPLTTVLAPVVRRGKFTDVWVVDAAGDVIARASRDTLRTEELLAVREAVARQEPRHSTVTVLGPHAASLVLVAPVHLGASVVRSARSPAAVVLRADLVKAFAPWAKGRPNAAMSLFSTPAPGGTVIISACPQLNVPVCIERQTSLATSTPAALALAQKDTFGRFSGFDGLNILALTRFDTTLGWGVIRRVSYDDAVVPLYAEMSIEGAFLLALLALVGLGAYAGNRTVRVRRLYAQREATERLSAVVDASTDGIISLDARFNITMVNAAVERMLGYSKSELMDRPVFTLFAEEWHEHLGATLRAFAQSSVDHAPVDETERCIALCSNGRLMPVDARVGRADMNGMPLYVMGLRDVSERARAENFVKGQRHVLEMIARGAPAGDTCDALLQVIHTEASEMRCAVYELESDRHIARLVSASDLPPIVVSSLREVHVGPHTGAIGTAIHSATTVLTRDVASDPLWSGIDELLIANDIRAAWAVPLRSADGSVIGALACYFNAAREPTTREYELAGTAIHLASIALSTARDAESLKLSEASFRSFVENTPAATFRERVDGHLESTNRAMVELLGYAGAAEMQVAAGSGRMYRSAAARQLLVDELHTNDVVRGMELEWVCADGSRVAVRISARAYRDEHGAVSRWEGYAENVTSLRRAQEALRQSEKLAAVGQLISGVAHELNNPLSSIMHFTEDLLSDERSPEDTEALGVIRDQARRSRAIVRDLLSFVRQREANTVPICFAEVVVATVRAMSPAIAESGVQVQVVDESQDSYVLADRAGLEQIVTNIVSNAVQASGSDGLVTVTTKCEGETCALVVEDTGSGIADDVLPRIFDPFFTTRQAGGGTGLGLSVTLGIVEQLGGRIAVASRTPGPGSRFVVTLPRIAADARVRLMTAETSATPVARPVALTAAEVPSLSAKPTRLAVVVDDEPSIRAALRRYFVRRGWAVEEAADGRAGLALIEQLGDRIGVVVSDLRMPGFSGIDLHDRLAISRPALLRRFIFSTGDVASLEAASFVERTLCPVLQKPFELRMLDDVVARVIEGAEAERVVA